MKTSVRPVLICLSLLAAISEVSAQVENLSECTAKIDAIGKNLDEHASTHEIKEDLIAAWLACKSQDFVSADQIIEAATAKLQGQSDG